MQRQPDAGGSWWTLVHHLGRYGEPLGIAAGLAAGRTLFDLARPWPLIPAIDATVGRRTLDQPWADLLAPIAASPVAVTAAAGLAMVTLAAAGGLIAYVSGHLAAVTAQRIGADLRAEIHARLLRQPLSFHHRYGPVELTGRVMGDVERTLDALALLLTDLAPALLTMAGMFLVLLVIDPPIALTGFAALPATVAFATVGLPRLGAAHHADRAGLGDLAARASETMRNLRLVQAFGREGASQRAFRAHDLAVLRARLDIAQLGADLELAADLLLAISASVALVIGVTQVLSGRMTAGLLVAVLIYLAVLAGLVRRLVRSGPVLGRGATSARRLVELLTGGEDAAGPSRQAPVLASPRREIRFCSVSFAYAPGRPALRDVDLVVRAGGVLRLFGPTGSGKSTLLSLLLRLHEPDSGQIVIDGADLASLDLGSVRQRMALVPQESTIFDGTLLDNIAVGRPGASEADVRAAARLAQLEEFAHSLPEGYRSQVGPGGLLLSAGQRRRLAIARALVREAPIMLLDEPAGGADPEEPDAVRLAGTGRTVVAVSRRPTGADAADRVALLRGGRVVEHGTHQALVAAGCEYARLWDLQRSDHTAAEPAAPVAAADLDPSADGRKTGAAGGDSLA